MSIGFVLVLLIRKHNRDQPRVKLKWVEVARIEIILTLFFNSSLNIKLTFSQALLCLYTVHFLSLLKPCSFLGPAWTQGHKRYKKRKWDWVPLKQFTFLDFSIYGRNFFSQSLQCLLHPQPYFPASMQLKTSAQDGRENKRERKENFPSQALYQGGTKTEIHCCRISHSSSVVYLMYVLVFTFQSFKLYCNSFVAFVNSF